MSRPSASELTAAITAMMEAVRASDLDTFTSASAGLLKLDVERAGIVAAAAIRSLLEEAFPDGLDSDDVRALLSRCAAGAVWWPDFDPDALLIVLGGALGMADPDQEPQVRRELLAQHAIFVIVELSATRPAAVPAQLRAAVDEIRRAETIELP